MFQCVAVCVLACLVLLVGISTYGVSGQFYVLVYEGLRCINHHRTFASLAGGMHLCNWGRVAYRSQHTCRGHVLFHVFYFVFLGLVLCVCCFDLDDNLVRSPRCINSYVRKLVGLLHGDSGDGTC